MTITELLRTARPELAGSSTPELDAELLLSSALGKSREWLLARPDEVVLPTETRQYHELLTKRRQGWSVAYLVGHKDFYGRQFTVTSAVLVPRPESELLIDQALADLSPGDTFLDVGTGSGCLAVTVALERPEVTVIATDSSKAALAVAEDNARHLKATVSLEEADLITGLDLPWEKTVVAANLPYVPEADYRANPDLRHEPEQALVGGPEGLDVIKRLLTMIEGLTEPPKRLLLEIDPSQQAWLTDRGFTIRPDLAGHPRLAIR